MSISAHAGSAAHHPEEHQLSTAENLILGHLLGRREGVAQVAQATCLPRAEVESLCASMLERGLLGTVEYAGRVLYCVR